MEESKILRMTIVVPEDKVGQDIRFMTKDDRSREFYVNKMKVDGGREVKPKKNLKFKTAGEHQLEFEISQGIISTSLFYCDYDVQIHVTSLQIPDTVRCIKERGFEHFVFECEFVIPDSVKEYGGWIDGCKGGMKYNWQNFIHLDLSIIPETEETKEKVVIKEGVKSITDAKLQFYTMELHIPASVEAIDPDKWYGLMYSADRIIFAENHPKYIIQNDCVVQKSNGIVLQMGRYMDALPETRRIVGGIYSQFIASEGVVPPALDVERLVLPEGLIALDSRVFPFGKMTKLKELVLPSTLTNLGELGGIQASELTIPASVTTISSAFLAGTIKSNPSPSKVTKVFFEGEYDKSKLDEIFEGCPENLTAYHNGQVVWTNVDLAKAAASESGDGLLISEDGKTVLECKEQVVSIVVPKGVKTIAEGAFKGNTTLKQITLPDTLKAIEKSAFEGCSALEEVIGGNKVSKIADNAFCKSGLKKIALPDTLKEIKKCVFKGCKSLAEVTLGNAVKKIGEYAFEDCPITSIQLPDTVEQIDRRAFANTLIEAINIPASLKKTAFAFQGSKLKHGDVPAGVQIDYSGCTELESYTLAEGITALPAYMLSDCAKIKEVEIPSAVTEIPTCAYRGTSISKVTLPGELVTIGGHAFQETDLEEVVMPDSVEKVEGNAFRGCKNLKRVVFGKSISSIGDLAFGECEALEEIVIPDGRAISMQPAAFSHCKNLKRIITREGTESKYKEQILKTTNIVVVFN